MIDSQMLFENFAMWAKRLSGENAKVAVRFDESGRSNGRRRAENEITTSRSITGCQLSGDNRRTRCVHTLSRNYYSTRSQYIRVLGRMVIESVRWLWISASRYRLTVNARDKISSEEWIGRKRAACMHVNRFLNARRCIKLPNCHS